MYDSSCTCCIYNRVRTPPPNPGKPWIFILVLKNPSNPGILNLSLETELGMGSYLNKYKTIQKQRLNKRLSYYM